MLFETSPCMHVLSDSMHGWGASKPHTCMVCVIQLMEDQEYSNVIAKLCIVGPEGQNE